MILRSVCIWISVFAIWSFLMNLIVSRGKVHEQKLTEIEKEIAEIRAEYGREQNQKSKLLKQREELSKKIEREIERGESAKLLLKANLETESPPAGKTSSTPLEMVVAKPVFWDRTPTEQGLNVGDWITIDGYPASLIGAEAVGTNGVITGWKWTNNNKLWGDRAMIILASQPTGHSGPADRIFDMVGFIEKPSSNKKVERVNEAYVQKWGSSDSVLIRVTAQISQVTPPEPTNRYPGQWGINLTDVDVELVKE